MTLNKTSIARSMGVMAMVAIMAAPAMASGQDDGREKMCNAFEDAFVPMVEAYESGLPTSVVSAALGPLMDGPLAGVAAEMVDRARYYAGAGIPRGSERNEHFENVSHLYKMKCFLALASAAAQEDE